MKHVQLIHLPELNFCTKQNSPFRGALAKQLNQYILFWQWGSHFSWKWGRQGEFLPTKDSFQESSWFQHKNEKAEKLIKTLECTNCEVDSSKWAENALSALKQMSHPRRKRGKLSFNEWTCSAKVLKLFPDRLSLHKGRKLSRQTRTSFYKNAS